MEPLTSAEHLKFKALAQGVTVSPGARERLDALRGERKLTPADYASTTGLILWLEDDVWVNAPTIDHNANFVQDSTILLDVVGDQFRLSDERDASKAKVWLPPRYHDTTLASGRPANHFVFSHGDRVRLSPIRGCAMVCKFCSIPYEDRYDLKPVDLMIEALQLAFNDPLQPASHALISGGTPAPRHVPFLQEVYERVLTSFPDRDIDIMMAPIHGLLDVPKLADLGVHELSINLEMFNANQAQAIMPQKVREGIGSYLRFIEDAAHVLGAGRVRSMMMVGLEAPEDSLAGVRAILDAGGVPVLSPFRPDPATPLRDRRPWSAEEYLHVFLEASALAEDSGVSLGPSCPPCTHNTLTLARGFTYAHPPPVMV